MDTGKNGARCRTIVAHYSGATTAGDDMTETIQVLVILLAVLAAVAVLALIA